MAGTALVFVEGGAQALGGGKYVVEQLGPRSETRQLGGSEAWKRRTGLARRGSSAATARAPEHGEQLLRWLQFPHLERRRMKAMNRELFGNFTCKV